MAKTIVLIDYGSGNLRSVAKAFEHVIATESLPYEIIISKKPKDISNAAKIILPGQGAFQDCMQNLQGIPDMIDTLNNRVLGQGIPFLGICVGMQLLADRGLEHGEYKGLGWIKGDVIPITPKNPSLKIPHMGWNQLYLDKVDHFLLRSIKTSATHEKDFYFVHSFMFQCKEERDQIAHVDYGESITAIIGRDNITGVQFHPEKSQSAGLHLIRDFLRWQI